MKMIYVLVQLFLTMNVKTCPFIHSTFKLQRFKVKIFVKILLVTIMGSMKIKLANNVLNFVSVMCTISNIMLT